MPPECNEDWFQLVPHLLSREGWEVAIERGQSSLSHCECPWGGHIIKCSVWDVTVTDPPEDPANILVRPETRGRNQFRCGDRLGQMELVQGGHAANIV